MINGDFVLLGHHHHHVPGLLQISAIMAFQSSLSSVLLMSSLVGDSFLVMKLFRLSVYFVGCHPLLLAPQIFPLNICFFSATGLFRCPKSCLFLVVLSRGVLYLTISITFLFDFFSVHDILIIILMYHISAASDLLSGSFVSVQHSHPCRRIDHVGFQSVGCDVNSDISVGEDGLHLSECAFRQNYSFYYFCNASGVWSHCEAQVFKAAYFFYPFPSAKNVTYTNACWVGQEKN